MSPSLPGNTPLRGTPLKPFGPGPFTPAKPRPYIATPATSLLAGTPAFVITRTAPSRLSLESGVGLASGVWWPASGVQPPAKS